MKKIFNEWKSVIFIALVILLLALTLRLINLTSIPVFADEAIYIRWAQVMRAESTLRFLPLSDGKQPLFMWSMIPFLKIFSDPLFAGRLLSVFTGIGSLIGVGVLSYLLFKSKKVSLISSFIYSVSPYALFFDRMALVDSMLAMFAVWSVIFTLLAVRYLRFDLSMLGGFALGGAVLTKSPALFISLLMPSVLLLSSLPKKIRKIVPTIAKRAIFLLPVYIIAVAMYNILRLGPNFHMLGSRNLDYVYPLSHIFEKPLDPFIPHFDRALEWIRILGPEILIFLILFGAIKNFTKYKYVILFLLLWSLVPVAIQSMYAKVFTARYIFFTLPFFYILAGSTFTDPLSSISKKILYPILTLFAVHSLFINYSLLTNPEQSRLPRSERSGYLEEWTAGTGIKEVSDYIRKEHEKDPNKSIVVGTEGYFGTLPDGLQIYLEKVPNVTVIGIGLGINKIPDQLQNAVKSGASAYLVANTSRLNFEGEFEESGLEIVAKYQKADRPEDIREFVQFGKNDFLYLFRVLEADTIMQQ